MTTPDQTNSSDRNTPHRHYIRTRVSEFNIPPIRDGLVLGRHAPIGCVAIRRAVELLQAAPFDHLELDDDIIGDIIVRRGLLRRLPQDKLLHFVMTRIKPLMGDDEIMHLEIHAEVLLEESSL